MELVIGDKLYSTWSLRPWLVLKRCGADFTETVIRLNRPDTAEQIARHSPAGQHGQRGHGRLDGDFVVFDLDGPGNGQRRGREQSVKRLLGGALGIAAQKEHEPDERAGEQHGAQREDALADGEAFRDVHGCGPDTRRPAR